MTVFNKFLLELNDKKGKEITSTFCYFLSNICTKAFSFITIPLYTNLLTTSEYGYLNTYNAWANVLSVVLGMSLSSAILGKVNQERQERNRLQSSVITLSILSAIIMSLIILMVYLIVYGRIDVIVFLALLQGYATFVVNYILQEWIVDNRYIMHSIVSIISVVIPITITCMIIKQIFQRQKYLCVIVPRAIVFLILMTIILFYIIARGKKLFDLSVWEWSLSYCVPIVFHSLSLTILLQADRIMLSSLYGLSESGIYSFIYNVALVIGVFIGALENTWKSWFFYNYGKVDGKLIRNKARVYIFLAIMGTMIYVLISPELVSLLATKEYTAQVYLTAPVALAYIVSFFYDFLVYIEYKKEVTSKIAMASLVAAIVNIGLNFMIIPKFGGIGAAFTTIVSYSTQFVMHLNVAGRLDQSLFDFKFFLPGMVVSIIGMCLIVVILNLVWIRMMLVALLIILFFIYMKVNKKYLAGL